MSTFFTKNIVAAALAVFTALGSACYFDTDFGGSINFPTDSVNSVQSAATLAEIPEYEGLPYVEINGNIPEFAESDKDRKAFEMYSSLDSLGRCGEAYAKLGTETMPTEERKSISSVHPTAWDSVKYDFIDGKNLYNRCHLIGFQLSGENANAENLITGTRYMNVDGMLPFENQVADYIISTGNHVLYRVIPIFDGNNLLASGVQMEAESVEDNGRGVRFNVYCYNVQPGVTIDYADGSSYADGMENADEITEGDTGADYGEFNTYILNTNSKKFHKPDCGAVKNMSEKNKQEYTGTRESLINAGYAPSKDCNP